MVVVHKGDIVSFTGYGLSGVESTVTFNKVSPCGPSKVHFPGNPPSCKVTEDPGQDTLLYSFSIEATEISRNHGGPRPTVLKEQKSPGSTPAPAANISMA
jgi:hypothetical protein